MATPTAVQLDFEENDRSLGGQAGARDPDPLRRPDGARRLLHERRERLLPATPSYSPLLNVRREYRLGRLLAVLLRLALLARGLAEVAVLGGALGGPLVAVGHGPVIFAVRGAPR